ncbi:MAG: type III-A CRISPR-associated protein Cas10/Csm1 [Chloroflexota bacterium]|nr:type III-A CRISPR-associated protein Cas10/Csm1 [Chloroflexota bacterium]
MSHEETLVLAALLHDIGVFWKRTSHPVDVGDDSREHAHLSARFIRGCFGEEWDESARLASSHHEPQDCLSKLLQVADRLSLSKEEHRAGAQSEATQLASLFTHVGDGGLPCHFPLSPLAAERAVIFPAQGRDEDPAASYASLWDAFVKEARAVSGLRWTVPTGLIDTLCHLLQKYTWCVPADVEGDVPDVSLFEHLRSTAAIALGMYRSGVTEEYVDALLNQPTGRAAHEPCLSLIAGDVCGVKRFVYTLSARGDPAGLHGRAFYVELLTEAAARWMLRQLGLCTANLLYCGGGRFYIIAQTIDEQTLLSMRRQISQALFGAHQGQLYIAVASHALDACQLERFPEALTVVEQRLAQAKQRWFSELSPAELHETVFGVRGAHPGGGTCAVCGAAGAMHTLTDKGTVCDLCHSMSELGRRLLDAGFLLMVPAAGERPPAHLREWQRLFYFGFGYLVDLFGEPLEANLGKVDAGAMLSRLNSADFVGRDVLQATRTKKNPPSLGFHFLAKSPPRRQGADDETAGFEDMSHASAGVSSIGVLCMDVDNVASLLQQGLGADASISRVCSASLLLRLFFEVWLANLCTGSNRPDGKGRATIHCIYCGGDDAFVIGSWSDIVELAWNARKDFAEFTCQNPSIGLSAGSSICSPGFPVFQMAKEAWESLEFNAKGMPGKDAVDYMGQTFHWADFERVREWRDLLAAAVTECERAGDRRTPRTLLALLTELYHDHRREQDVPPGSRLFHGPTVHYGPWMWKAAYHLSEMARGLPDPARSTFRRIREMLMDAERLPVELCRLAVAARWVEMLSGGDRGKRA